MQELQHRYAGSVLGLVWAALYPLLLLGFYAVVYVLILRVRPADLDERAYVVLVLSGLVPLLAFLEALTASTGSLSANRTLLLNTVFPAELIPLRSILAAQIPSLFGLTVVVILALILGRASVIGLLFLPLLWVLLIFFVTGLGWVLSLFTLVARDVQQALGIVGMTILVLSPAAYTPAMVPSGLKALIYLNPLSYFVFNFQDIICLGRVPDGLHLAVAAALGVASLFGGFAFFQKVKFVFFDYA
jgi:lipopolysaccharide transport system permease protein